MIQNPFESYFITSDSLYPNHSVKIFEHNLQKIFSTHHIQKACFRDNSKQIPTDLLQTFLHYCLQYNVMSFINLAYLEMSFEYAQKYEFEGVHIKGGKLKEAQNLLNKNIKTFYSAHQKEEISQALDAGIDFITISPIFPTPNKPNTLGATFLDDIHPHFKKSLFALGGIINQKEIDVIKSKGLKGFASIRYFLKDPSLQLQ